MNRKWWKFLFLLPISVCTLYAGGYAAQFIKTSGMDFCRKLCRQRNLSASSFFTPIGLLSYRPYRFPIQFVWDFSLPGSLWASYFLLMRMGYDRNGKLVTMTELKLLYKGTYGTSRIHDSR